MWMLSLYLHVNQKSDYDMIYYGERGMKEKMNKIDDEAHCLFHDTSPHDCIVYQA